eukprot:c13984_g1_i2 orf=223-2751(+)
MAIKSFLKLSVPTAFWTFMCMTASLATAQHPSDSDSAPSPSSLPPPLSPPPPSSPLPLPLGEDPDSFSRFQVTLEVLWNGMVTARDPQTNEVRWSFSSGNPLSSAHGLLMDAYEGTNSSVGITGDDAFIPEDEFVFCGTDWKLYSFDKQHGLGVLPIPPHELIQNTPTVLNGALILGTMTTSVFLLDAKSGSLVRSFDSRNESFTGDQLGEEDIWRFLERSLGERRNADYLFVFRKDYTIKSVSMASGALLWNVSVGDVQLHHINSDGILRLPAGGERSLRDSSLSQAVPPPVALPAGYEKPDRFLPAQVHVSKDSAASVAKDSAWHLLLGLGSIKIIVSSAFVMLVCAIAPFFVWKRSSIRKQNEQVPKKRKMRKTKAGAGALPQEPTQDTNGPNADLSVLPDEPKEQVVLGRLHVMTKKHIGCGSNGTMVFVGYLDKRPVAVKRMLKQYYDKAQKEINHLIKSDEHPNILRYYHVDSDSYFVYVALERCRFSLNDLVLAQSFQRLGTYEGNAMPGDLSKEELKSVLEKVGDTKECGLWDEWARPSAKLLQLMRDILAGLSHLHDVGIVHRDLKPHNVLISSGRMSQAKLSDMGISKELADGLTSLDTQSTSSGSSGWQAPEQLMRKKQQTSSADLFSLGCILFFTISGGYHPFGRRFERDGNIINGKPDLFLVEHVPEAIDLISALLQHDPAKRPQMGTVRAHPLFWSSDMRLKFLCDASDRVELEDKESESLIIEDLEVASQLALGCSWADKLDAVFLQNLGKYRKYNYNSVRDLLRVIRNKSSHFRELPQEVQELFTSYPEGFETYFRMKFPKLLVEVFKIVYRHCGNEEGFRKYFVA